MKLNNQEGHICHIEDPSSAKEPNKLKKDELLLDANRTNILEVENLSLTARSKVELRLQNKCKEGPNHTPNYSTASLINWTKSDNTQNIKCQEEIVLDDNKVKECTITKPQGEAECIKLTSEVPQHVDDKAKTTCVSKTKNKEHPSVEDKVMYKQCKSANEVLQYGSNEVKAPCVCNRKNKENPTVDDEVMHGQCKSPNEILQYIDKTKAPCVCKMKHKGDLTAGDEVINKQYKSTNNLIQDGNAKANISKEWGESKNKEDCTVQNEEKPCKLTNEALQDVNDEMKASCVCRRKNIQDPMIEDESNMSNESEETIRELDPTEEYEEVIVRQYNFDTSKEPSRSEEKIKEEECKCIIKECRIKLKFKEFLTAIGQRSYKKGPFGRWQHSVI